MGECDFCGKLVKDARQHNVLCGSLVCDDCRETWDETEMMYYDVLHEEEEE